MTMKVQGGHTAARLFRDLKQDGYAGSYALVTASARRLRQAQGLAPGATPSAASPRGQRPSSTIAFQRTARREAQCAP